MNKRRLPFSQKRLFKRAYILILIVMAFTGFGQMPIFKRYYLADIPGLGWTADFFATHTIHYIGAILLLGFLAYIIMDFFLSDKKGLSLTGSAYVRMVLLAGLTVTGILMVLKNLPQVTFSPDFTVMINLAHLGLTMLFLFTALLFLFLKRGWVVSR